METTTNDAPSCVVCGESKVWSKQAEDWVDRPLDPCEECGDLVCEICSTGGVCLDCSLREKVSEGEASREATGEAESDDPFSGDEDTGGGEKSRETGREAPQTGPDEIEVDLDPPFEETTTIDGVPIDSTTPLDEWVDEDPEDDEDDLDPERLKDTAGKLESVSVDPGASQEAFVINPTKTLSGAFSIRPKDRLSRIMSEVFFAVDWIDREDLSGRDAVRALSPWILNLVDLAIEFSASEMEGRDS